MSLLTKVHVAAAIVTLLLLSPLATLSSSPTPLRALKLHFTARDFMAAGCMRHNEIDNYWFGDSNAKQKNPRWINMTARCPIRTDILEGTYSGHPDFEASPFVFFEGCGGTPTAIAEDRTKPNFTVHSGGVSCAHVFRGSTGSLSYPSPVTKIVETDMEFHEDGLPKPVYCRNGPYLRGTENGTRRCGWGLNPITKDYQVSTTGKTSFDLWYRDDPRYSKRVGFDLELKETTQGSGMYQYFSPSFHPFNHILPCEPTADFRLNCSNGGKVWPRAVMGLYQDPYDERTDERGAFAFTTELHSFFTFVGNETFEFRGDDDVYVYINERLALDVGGLHVAVQSVINLTHWEVQERLGLVKGEVYALDIFHAERKTIGSNFGLTTSLRRECGVLESARLVFDSNTDSDDDDEDSNSKWKLVGASFLDDPGISNRPRLQLSSGQPNSASYAFIQHQRMNLAPGFIASFRFRVVSNRTSPATKSVDGGFAFVMHRGDSLENLNGGSSLNYGFHRNLPSALGIVFDMHANRVAMMTTKNSNSNNITESGDTLVHAPLMHPNDCLRDGQEHRVEIRFYGDRPNWMEVYLDDDLFLQKRQMKLMDTFLTPGSPSLSNGEVAPWVGFTSGFGSVLPPSSVEIFDVEIRTIALDRSRTRIAVPETMPRATADGRDKLEFTVETFDSCGNSLGYGGFAHELKARLIPYYGDVGGSRRRLSADGDDADDQNSLEAIVVDELNGKYRLEFKSSSSPLAAGSFALYAWFGNESLTNGTLVAEFLSPPVTPTPTSPEVLPAARDDLETIRYIGAGLGGVCALGTILILFGCVARKRWRAAKKYVNPGREAVAEKEVRYEGDAVLDDLQKRVYVSAQRLNAERARQRELVSEEIPAIQEQIEKIRCEIRKLKEKRGNAKWNEEDADTVPVVVDAAGTRPAIPLRPRMVAAGDRRKVEFNAIEIV